jgi:hypothetical protein
MPNSRKSAARNASDRSACQPVSARAPTTSASRSVSASGYARFVAIAQPLPSLDASTGEADERGRDERNEVEDS